MAIDVKDYNLTDVVIGKSQNTKENKDKVLLVTRDTTKKMSVPYKNEIRNIYLQK